MPYFTNGTFGIMKFRTVLFLLLVGYCKVSAQNFAPVGAKWHYTEYSVISSDINYTFFESLKDTVFNGVQCREIGGAPNSCAWTSQFVYDSNDSVYFWHQERGEFCLLYDFGAEAGDEWTIYHNIEVPGQPDSSILVVDSVSVETIDGEWLKVAYTTRQNQSSDWWSVGGKVIERIGGAYLFPVSGVCDPLPGELRCYQDSVVYFIQGQYDCDEIISSVEEHDASLNLRAYPNPTGDFVNIDFEGNHLRPTSIKATGSDGKRIVVGGFQTISNTVRLDIKGFPTGLYLIELQFGSSMQLSTKIYKP